MQYKSPVCHNKSSSCLRRVDQSPQCTALNDYALRSALHPASLPVPVLSFTTSPPNPYGLYRENYSTHSQCLLTVWSPPLRKTRRAHVCCAARTSTCSRWGSAITRCVTAAPPRCGCCASRSTAPSAGSSSTRCRLALSSALLSSSSESTGLTHTPHTHAEPRPHHHSHHTNVS